LIRVALYLLSLGFVLSAGLVAVLTEAEPSLPPTQAPDAQDVRRVRAAVQEIRAVTDGRAAVPELAMEVGTLAGVIRLGARFLPGLRAEARIEDGAVQGRAALPVPGFGGRWLNVAATVPPFEGGFAPAAVSVGRVTLPPGPSVALARRLANLLIGDRAGDTIIGSAEAMRIEGQRLVFTLNLGAAGRGAVLDGVFAALRGGAMPSPDRIDAAHARIMTAMEAGSLPAEGSLLPHLRFALDLAEAEAETDADIPDAYTVAIFGLAKACGAAEFRLLVGRLAGADAPAPGRWRVTCDAVTLAGRTDTRQHFLIAAAIKAASNRGFAVAIGEFKELHDTITASGGFDFTDIAANNSGIRLSDRMMAAPLADWPALRARIVAEGDVLADFDGVPGRIGEAEFAARFGTIDSQAYREMLARIERRIDALPIHRPVP